MKKGIVISDAGPIFSLVVIGELDILNSFFDEIHIPNAVWEEISEDETTEFYPAIASFFKQKVTTIKGKNHLTFIMDYGESEAVILYQELSADFLLIDDRKARAYAESMGINCIGTIGILMKAKSTGLIKNLRPLFIQFIQNKRFYSLKLLNPILAKFGEEAI